MAVSQEFPEKVSVFRAAAQAETEAEVKATAGVVAHIDVVYANATVAYLQIFNLRASAVTVGTTAPAYTFALTNGVTRIDLFGHPLNCSGAADTPQGAGTNAGITIAITSLRTNAVAPAATANIEIFYR